MAGFFGYVTDRYIELDETKDLAGIEATDAGVTGSIAGFADDPRLHGDGGADSGAQVIMHVTIEDPMSGETPEARIVDGLLPMTGDQTVATSRRYCPRARTLFCT